MKTVEELQAELEKALESITKLESKNSELIGREKEAKTKAEKAENEKEDAQTEAAKAAGDLEALEKQLEKKYKKQIDDLTKDRDQAQADLKTIRVDAEISNAIAKGNVIKDHVDAVEALLHRKIQYDDGVATIDGKPIADFTKDYFAKAGAVYVNAANNSGAGTQGNDGTKATAHKIPKDASEIDADLMKLSVTDPAQFNSIMDQAGLSAFRV